MLPSTNLIRAGLCPLCRKTRLRARSDEAVVRQTCYDVSRVCPGFETHRDEKLRLYHGSLWDPNPRVACTYYGDSLPTFHLSDALRAAERSECEFVSCTLCP